MRRLLFALLPLALATAACAVEPADDEEAAEDADALAARAALPVHAVPNVSYGADRARVLDLYEPAAGPTRDRPLVVWIHGGAFAYGTRRDPHLVRLARHTASLGFVSVSIDYTLANLRFDHEHPFPYPATAVGAAREDALAAISFLRAHAEEYGIDPHRIAVGGASAGAITALHVAYGSTPSRRDEGIRAVVDLWGAFESRTLLQRGDAPLLILHGTADQHWMPFAQAERLRDSARAADVPCVFLPLPGKSHGPWEDLGSYLDHITPFLRRHLARR